MVTRTWGRSPPAVGRLSEVRAALQAPTRPSRSCWARVRRSRSEIRVHSGCGRTGMVRVHCRYAGVPSVAVLHRSCVACGGPGVGGGVHGGEEVFVLVGCGENFQVVQSAAGWADEGSLRWRSSCSLGSVPSASIASVQWRAMRARKSASLLAACGEGVFHPGGQVFGGVVLTRSRARVMMVAGREATDPAVRAAASSGRRRCLGVAGESRLGQYRGGKSLYDGVLRLTRSGAGRGGTRRCSCTRHRPVKPAWP